MRARRSLAAAALVTIAFTATACGGSTDNAGNGAGADGPAKDGGAITIRGCTPENPLIGSNTTEVCGGNVIDAVYALSSLLANTLQQHRATLRIS